MSDARDKTFQFACPECFVSLKARVAQAGARLTCPSCSASILVPDAPAPKSVAGKTDRTIDTSAAQSGGEYDLHSSGPATAPAPDLITVTCDVCATRTFTDRKNLGKKIRCSECGTVVPIVEAPKSQEQMRRPQKIDEAGVGEYGVSSPEHPSGRHEDVSIPFHCKLCEGLLRGSLAEVGKELTCSDCGTKTVVPVPKKTEGKAFVGAAAGEDLSEYGIHAPNVAEGSSLAVICSLCHSRLMARTDQVGQKLRCPDCGAETVVTAAPESKTGAVMGVMAETADKAGGDYALPDPAATPDSQRIQREKVVHIGVDCPRCGTRIHATDRQVGKKVPCPDCDTPVTIPPPKADAIAEEQAIGDDGEYTVSGPQIVVAQTPMSSRALPRDPGDDPDFDFLDDADKHNDGLQWKDRSARWGFLGHPDATSRWLGFCIGGVVAFTLPAVSLLLFGMPRSGLMTGTIWFAAFISLALSGLVCLAWAALLSINLLAVTQDTAAGNHVIQNWPDRNWADEIGDCFYVFNSAMVSFIPVSILMQNCPAARPWAAYLYTLGFWLTMPVALLSMFETGSVFAAVSGNVLMSLFRRPVAWAWFYLRSLFLIVTGLAVLVAAWLFLLGPLALPIFAPLATTIAMIYFRWLGILGISVGESIEEAAEAAEEAE